jgi:hypothetical protein
MSYLNPVYFIVLNYEIRMIPIILTSLSAHKDLSKALKTGSALCGGAHLEFQLLRRRKQKNYEFKVRLGKGSSGKSLSQKQNKKQKW